MAGLNVHLSQGVEATIIGAIGDERKIDPESFEGLPVVEKVLRILSPFRLVSREFQKEDTVVTVRGQKFDKKGRIVAAGGFIAGGEVAGNAAAMSSRARRTSSSFDCGNSVGSPTARAQITEACWCRSLSGCRMIQ